MQLSEIRWPARDEEAIASLVAGGAGEAEAFQVEERAYGVEEVGKSKGFRYQGEVEAAEVVTFREGGQAIDPC